MGIVRDFLCRECGQRLSFENSLCLHCQSPLGFWLETKTFYTLDDSGKVEVDGKLLEKCANAVVAQCNWLVEWTGHPELCASCTLTRTRPADADTEALKEFGQAESAKRRLVLELNELGLPISGYEDNNVNGLAFDLLSSASESVVTGHANGVITLDLAEGDDVHREQMRVELAEPYRTVLGHFRHEIGHYYQMVLVDDETFAHYLHIRDTLDTAAAFAMAPAGSTLDSDLPGDVGFDRIVEWWLPLSWALNQINRSMGHPDMYPFVLAGPVLDKIRYVHGLISAD